MSKIGKISFGVFDTKENATRIVEEKSTGSSSSKVAYWGENNQLPSEILTTGKKNGVFVGGMGVLRKAHYGEGPTYYSRSIENGKKKMNLLDLEDLPEDMIAFVKKNKLNYYFMSLIHDLEYFQIGFSEYVLSNDFKTINRVKRIPAAWCRFQKMDDKGYVKKIFIKTDWSNSNIDTALDLQCIDFFWDTAQVRDYCIAKKIKKFIRPNYHPLAMESYYPDPEYLATLRNGWLEHSNKIPEIKNNLIENELHIKYMIYISDEYFERLYGRNVWATKSIKEQEKVRDTLFEEIDDHLSGTSGAGRSLKSPKFKNDRGDWVKGIEVEEVGSTKGRSDGGYLTDASAANQETLFSMGVDPSIIGAGIPGAKLGAGSGSDKREAYNILSSLMKFNREISSEPFSFISEYNEWDSSVHMTFTNTTLTTLDKNPTGVQSTS